jgi:hypothetical protein
MDKSLLIANAVAFGLLFAVWSKNSVLNFVIKVTLLGLLIFNILGVIQ